MRYWKSITAATLLLGAGTAPVIPQEPMEMELAYQVRVADLIEPAEYVSSTSSVRFIPDKHPALGMVDEDGNGLISIAVYRPGNQELHVKIPDALYKEMGEPNGVSKNPKREQNASLIDVVFLNEARAAIAVDATLPHNGGGSTATSITKAFTVGAGSNRLLLAFGHAAGSDWTAGTWDGNAMSTLGAGFTYNSTANVMRGFYLAAPASGTFNIVLSGSGTADRYMLAMSLTGAAQSGIPDASNTESGVSGAGSQNISVTTVADNAWVVGFFGDQLSGTNAGCNPWTTAGTNTTVIVGTSNDHAIGYTPTAQTPAGSKTIVLNHSALCGGSHTGYGIIAYAIAPAVAATLQVDDTYFDILD